MITRVIRPGRATRARLRARSKRTLLADRAAKTAGPISIPISGASGPSTNPSLTDGKAASTTPGSSIGLAEQRHSARGRLCTRVSGLRGVRYGYPARFRAGHCCTPRDWKKWPRAAGRVRDMRTGLVVRDSFRVDLRSTVPSTGGRSPKIGHVLMDAQLADEHCRPPPARGTCPKKRTDTIGSSDLASIDRLTIHPQGDTAGGRRCKPWYAARLLACRAPAIDSCGASTTSVPARRSWNPRRLPSNRIRT